MLQTKSNKNPFIKTLFRLRGLPQGITTIEQLTWMGFVKLAKDEGKEVLYGILTDIDVFRDGRLNLTPLGFIALGNLLRIRRSNTSMYQIP